MHEAPDHRRESPYTIPHDEVPTWHASEIAPGLFMGGTDDGDVVQVAQAGWRLGDERPYDAVVTLYAWAQPVPWEVEELRYGFGDCDIRYADTERILRAARWAWRRWVAGDRVLIRCQAGLNRSGLITALVLMLEGYAADEAVPLIRRRRSAWCLCNGYFESWLSQEAPALLSPYRQPSVA
jgi:hypothetical protein